MLLVDANVLIYAADETSPHYQAAMALVQQMINGDEPFGMSELVLSSFIRIITNPKLLLRPLTPAEAFAFVDIIRSSPMMVVLQPGPDHWRIFHRLCVEQDIRGPRVSDAYHAALAMEYDCEWISNDKGFSTYRGLRWRPLSGS